MGMNKSATESILLVDDNPTNLQVLFQTLEGVGCKLLIAKNGQGALAIAAKALPDLILLDIMMPDIDGYEVCRKLKSNPATADIPVIFLSALVETEDKVKGLQLGAVDYITKPFQPAEVIARVNTHLTIHRLKSEVESQKDKLEHELEVVSEVQRKLLPKKINSSMNLKWSLRCSAVSCPKSCRTLTDSNWPHTMKPAAMPAGIITTSSSCLKIAGDF
jgi:sigma-B regulation protein RsbU (phosphoserine phosphatase)